MTDKTKELTEFLASLEHRQPTIPDELSRYALKRGGWKCKDTGQELQLLRLISYATQMFLASVIDDSLQISKQRRHQPQTRLKEQGLKDQRTSKVLATEDLAVALQEVSKALVNLETASRRGIGKCFAR